MNEPEAVIKTYAEMRRNSSLSLVLRTIKGNYYVYSQKVTYDKETKKQKIHSEYLGKINENGVFIKKGVPKEERKLETAKSLIESYGGKIVWTGEQSNIDLGESEGASDSDVDLKILTAISGDARISSTELAKVTGLSPASANRRLKNLEQRYGIKYTLDTELNLFNFYTFVSLIKFINKKPNFALLTTLIDNNPYVRLALHTIGDYDLIIFFMAESPFEAEDTIYAIRSNEIFKDIKAEWVISYQLRSQGFFPYRDQFLNLISKKVWKRTKEQPRKKYDQLFFREYVTLKELISNSRVQFNYIDTKYGLKQGSAHYTYKKLMGIKNIKSTITMQNPQIKGTAIFLVSQIDIVKFNKNRIEFLKYQILNENEPLNKVLFSGDLGAPYGILLMMPYYKEGDVEKFEIELSNVLKGCKIKTSIISNILVGNLGYRKIAIEQTTIYKFIQELNKKKTI